MPRVTKNTGKKTIKPRRIFNKRIIIDVTGTSKTDINKVASAIHAIQTPETKGGKDERTVQLTHESTEVRQVFYGNI